MNPYRILDRKRHAHELSVEEIEAVVQGAADGTWSDDRLAAFLMASAIHGLSEQETLSLTSAMRRSGELWNLSEVVPQVVDKHSTGGVGDKVTLVLGPLLASCGVPCAMLTGRSLGHTGGTEDKLETIPGLDQGLTRQRALKLLDRTGLAIGMATGEIAPADRTLYRLRDRTATVSSLPLVISSILSKKLATGCAGIVFDVKTGNGAFFPERSVARELGQKLVDVSTQLGCRAEALLTDMNQPLGRWVGNSVEVEESLACLRGEGDSRLVQLTVDLCLAAARQVGMTLAASDLRDSLSSGKAMEKFLEWADAQGAASTWLTNPDMPRARQEVSIRAPFEGKLVGVETRQIGQLLFETALSKPDAGGGAYNPEVGLYYAASLGEEVGAGDELCRVFAETDTRVPEDSFLDCFTVQRTSEEPSGFQAAPELVYEVLRPGE